VVCTHLTGSKVAFAHGSHYEPPTWDAAQDDMVGPGAYFRQAKMPRLNREKKVMRVHAFPCSETRKLTWGKPYNMFRR